MLTGSFAAVGVRYERLDVGNGNLGEVQQALRHGITPLVLYNAQAGTGGLVGVSPSQAASNITSIARRLQALAARYPRMNKLRAIEFGNEVYVGESVTTYAAQYEAAHRALAASGLSSWRLLAVGTAICGYDHAESWIHDLIHLLPGGAREVDGWTVHPYGPLNTDSSPDCRGPHGYGWPDVRDWHRIAVHNGSNAPWYITEVGKCVTAGQSCPQIVDRAAQAAALTRYLNDASKYRYVAFFDWYTSCDDRSGGWGLLTEDAAGVCAPRGPVNARPAFKALKRWIAAHGEA